MPTLPLTARPAIQALRSSKIREVANAAMDQTDVAAFWFGEPDQVTPDFIRQAAIDSLNAGETFYTHNLGIPPLREAIARYVTRLHHRVDIDNIAVTNSGMSALMVATQALVGAGDRVVIVTPAWPNLVEIPKILGAEAVPLSLTFAPSGWTLDIDHLLSALTPDTRMVCINAPSNPTGWAMDRAAQEAVLAHCRKYGIWILADDAYERLYFGNQDCIAPTFLDIAEPEDRVISANTFSKAWLMTGWRLGWLVMPRELADSVGTLIEYNTSCAPAFVQRAGIVALEQGEDVIKQLNTRLRHARDLLLSQLAQIPDIEIAVPPGAMYAFFRVAGADDSLAFCKWLVTHAGLGLAPGIAFGPEGEGFVRWCFAASDERLQQGIDRFRRALGR